MIKKFNNNYKSLLSGIGNHTDTKNYYDKWANNYDKTLKNWNYKSPSNACKILKSYLSVAPKYTLDLACGTGLFAEELLKIYPSIVIDGIDISLNILKKAKKKKIYRQLIHSNFDKKLFFKTKYDLISCIGAMTYTLDPLIFIDQVFNYTNLNGYFVFTHRVDLWKIQNFSNILKFLEKKWEIIYISRSMLYLPNNSDFGDKIKVKIALLKKI